MQSPALTLASHAARDWRLIQAVLLANKSDCFRAKFGRGKRQDLTPLACHRNIGTILPYGQGAGVIKDLIDVATVIPAMVDKAIPILRELAPDNVDLSFKLPETGQGKARSSACPRRLNRMHSRNQSPRFGSTADDRGWVRNARTQRHRRSCAVVMVWSGSQDLAEACF